MEWLKDRTWQLAVSFVLALVGGALMYSAGTAGQDRSTLGLGLLLVLVALAIPLVQQLLPERQRPDSGKGGS